MNIINKTLFSAIIFASSQCVSSDHKLTIEEIIETPVVNNASSSVNHDALSQHEMADILAFEAAFNSWAKNNTEEFSRLELPLTAEKVAMIIKHGIISGHNTSDTHYLIIEDESELREPSA